MNAHFILYKKLLIEIEYIELKIGDNYNRLYTKKFFVVIKDPLII